MDIRSWFAASVAMLFILVGAGAGGASETEFLIEKSMSDTLDIWRAGRYEQLFEQLATRGTTSRETFVKKMRGSTTRPACCWQKMENFRVVDENGLEATIYAKIGLEGTAGSASSATREFRLTYQEGVWKMQLPDVLRIAGTAKKKGSGKKQHSKKSHGSNL